MDSQDVLALILVYGIIAASLGASKLAAKAGAPDDVVRKVVHCGVGMFVFVWWMFSEQWIMLAFFAVPFAIVLLLAAFPGNPVSDSPLGELSSGMGHRFGLLFYVVTIIVMIVFFFDHWTAASVGIAAMTFGDCFGSIVGKRCGRHKIFNGKKSAEGSLAVFAATAIVAVVLMYFYSALISGGYYVGDDTAVVPYVVCGAVAGIVASVLECVTPGEFDNLTNPILVALTMVALGLRHDLVRRGRHRRLREELGGRLHKGHPRIQGKEGGRLLAPEQGHPPGKDRGEAADEGGQGGQGDLRGVLHRGRAALPDADETAQEAVRRRSLRALHHGRGISQGEAGASRVQGVRGRLPADGGLHTGLRGPGHRLREDPLERRGDRGLRAEGQAPRGRRPDEVPRGVARLAHSGQLGHARGHRAPGARNSG